MRRFIFPLLFLSIYLNVQAQSNYNMTNFSFSHSLYSDISGTGNEISMTDKENGSSTTAQEIGFTFQYNGTAFTQFTIHADGILRLGNEAPGAATLINTSPDQSLVGVFTSTDPRFQNVIMPLFTDLVQGIAAPQYHTTTIGTAPNRVCTIQWKNLRDANSPTVLNRNQYSNMEFQVKLYETSNDIEIVYGNFTPTSNTPLARFATCGIKSGATSFLGFYRTNSIISYDKSALLNPSANVRILSDFRFSNLKIPAAGFSTRFFGRISTDVSVAKLFYDSITPAGTQTPGQIVALIKNDGLQPVSNVVVNFAISGANTHNYQTTINTLAANDSAFVDIPAFSMANTGAQNINVSVTVSNDARAANNNRSAVQIVSKSHLQSYDFSNSGNIGVGFNVSSFVAVKVLGQGIRKIAQVRIPFNTYRNSVRFRIYEDGGTGGAPSASPLYSSPLILTDDVNGQIFSLNPTIQVNGNYYIAVQQSSTTNMQWKVTVTNPSLPNRAYTSNNGINWEIEPSSQPWNKLFEIFEENTNADIGIESLVNPGCNYNNAADVQVSLRNFSANPIDFSLTPATISGFAKTPTGTNLPFSFEKNSGTLVAGASENVTILQNYNFSTRGVHTFNARTNLSGDTESNNDSLNFRFINGLFIGKIPETSVCPITEVKLFRNNIYGNMQWSVNGSSSSTDTLTLRPVKSTTVYLSGVDYRGCTLLDSTVITVLTEGLPPRPILKNNSNLLNHRNEFKDTVRVNRLPGHTVQWLGGIGTVVSDTALVINQVSGLNGATVAAAYTRISDGCSNVSDTISYNYGAGVLFNSSTPLTVCDTSFYDSGGPLNLHNGNFTRTFTPASIGTKMKFSLYGLSLPSFVNLEVFDGNSTSAPRIKAFSSQDNGFEKREYIASNEDGVLTIRISSSGIVAGWWGGLTCHKPEVYRTISNGNWNNPLIWEKKNVTGMYVSSNSFPQKGDDSIYIRHNVLISNSYLIDQVVVEENGNLRIESPDANFISINTYKVLPQPEFLVRGTLALNDKVQIFGNNGYMEVKGNLINAGKIDLDSVLFTGNQPQILGSPGFTGELRNIRISNPAGITLAGSQQVAGIRFDKGLINTDNIAMIILSEGELSTGAGTASHINGPAAIGLFGSGNRIYPIGKNGIYLPVELNCLDAQSFDNFETVTAEINSGAPAARSFPSGINAVSQVRYFTLSRNINNGTSYQITLPYTATEGVSDPAKLTIARGKGALAWEDLGGTASGAAPGTIQSEAFEELGEFVLANETGGTNGLLTALPDLLFDRVNPIRVYPNPAMDHIMLSFQDTWRTSPMHIQLLDMQGRLLKTWQFTGYSNGLALWMGDIPAGNYMLDIRNDKYQKQTIQVIKR